MESSKIYASLFICMLFISSATPILGCGYCGKPPKKHEPGEKPKTPITVPPIVKPPITVPPIVKPVPPVTVPPITVPPIVKPVPPVTVPPITVPPIVTPVPPVTVPPILKPPIALPPIVKPPVTLPPIIVPPVTGPPVVTNPPGPGCRPRTPTCPIGTLKLGACVDLLGGLVHIGVGDPAVNQCCPVLQGLVALEAAVCLCTTLKLKLLNLNIYVPLALELLVACGKTPPPGYTCSL